MQGEALQFRGERHSGNGHKSVQLFSVQTPNEVDCDVDHAFIKHAERGRPSLQGQGFQRR